MHDFNLKYSHVVKTEIILKPTIYLKFPNFFLGDSFSDDSMNFFGIIGYFKTGNQGDANLRRIGGAND